MKKIPFLLSIIISYIYSLLTSFLIIRYFRNKKRTNFFVKLITTIHFSFLFFMSELAYMSIEDPQESLSEIDLDKINKLIEIISWINYFFSFILYPLTEIYIKSGYFSWFNIYKNVSIKVYLLNYSIIPLTIIVVIIYLIFKDYLIYFYDNIAIFLLNYLNIIELMSIYFEIGFCYSSIYRYTYKVCRGKEEYIPFILGKLYYDEIEIKAKFRKQYNKLLKIKFENNPNILEETIDKKYKKMKKEVEAFIEEVNSIEYLENLEDNNLDKENEDINNINIQELELKLGKPFQKSKDLKRHLERINNIRIELIKKKGNSKKSCCYYCCNNRCCEITRYVLFIFICLLVVGIEYAYHRNFSPDFSSYNNTKLFNDFINNNNTNNTSDWDSSDESERIIAFIIVYPLRLFLNFLSVGQYICLIIYSLLNRTYITGDFFYGKNYSDNLNLIYSVNALSGIMIPLFYLQILNIVLFVKKDEFIARKDNRYIFLNLLKIPHTNLVLWLRYIFILLCALLTMMKDKIVIKCNSCCKIFKKGIVFNICDEYNFLPTEHEPCCLKLIEGDRKQYIKKGREEEIKLLNINENTYILAINI